jgi:hypothetical protein
MRLGDLIYTITKYTGIHYLTKLIVERLLGFESCGCDKRRKKFNQITISRNGRFIKDE